MFDEIKKLSEKVDYCWYIDVVEDEWSFQEDDENDYIYWKHDKSVYGSEIKEGVGKQDDCVYVNTDTGCGDTVTVVLHRDKQLKWDCFYDKYEDEL